MFIQSYYDFSRDYRFYAMFWRNIFLGYRLGTTTFNSIAELTEDNVALTYLATLVKEMTPPLTEVKTEDIDYSALSFPMLSKLTSSQFTVTFMEDLNNSVLKFYNLYVSRMFQAGPSTVELYKLSFSMMFTRNTVGGDGLEIPSHVDTFPRVVPIKLEGPATYSKSGESFVTRTITFIRLPEITRYK